MKINCSKGTYVRTLCADIGRALGCYGYMSYLLRTASGVFTLDNTVTLEELTELARARRAAEALLPMDYPLMHLPRADFATGQARRSVERHDRAVCVRTGRSRAGLCGRRVCRHRPGGRGVHPRQDYADITIECPVSMSLPALVSASARDFFGTL